MITRYRKSIYAHHSDTETSGTLDLEHNSIEPRMLINSTMKYSLTFFLTLLIYCASAQNDSIPPIPNEPEPPDPGNEVPQDAIAVELDLTDMAEVEYPYSALVSQIQSELTRDDLRIRALRNSLVKDGKLPGFPSLEEFEQGSFSSTELDLVMILYMQRLVKITHRQQQRIKELEKEVENLKN